MTLYEALQPIASVRGQRVVISSMASVGIWPSLSDTPLDFSYMPSSMGQGISLALGFALAQPHRGAIVIMGDGSLLMNLGALVTVAGHPAPLHIVLIDNGIYEVTGGQRLPGAGRVDYAGLARAAGIERVYAFDDLDQWQAACATAFSDDTPVFISLKVDGVSRQTTPKPPHTMKEQIARLTAATQIG